MGEGEGVRKESDVGGLMVLGSVRARSLCDQTGHFLLPCEL